MVQWNAFWLRWLVLAAWGWWPGALSLLAHEQFGVQHFTAADGLPHGVGYQLVRDAKGYLWIGTDNGLARYDGHQFVTVRMRDGLPTPYVVTLSQAPDGALWAGLHRSYLCRIWGEDSMDLAIQSMPHYNPKPLFYARDSGLCVELHPNFNKAAYSQCFATPQGWQHTYMRLPSRLSGDTLRAAPISLAQYQSYQRYPQRDESSSDRFSAVLNWYQSPTRDIWMVSHAGLYHYAGGRTFLRVPETRDRPLYAVTQGQGQSMWLGGEGCLYHLMPGQPLRKIALPNVEEPIIQLEANDAGQVFFFTISRKELYVYSHQSGTLQTLNESLGLNGDLSTLYLDGAQQLWLTTNGDGVYCLYPHAFAPFHPPGPPLDDYLTDVQQTASGAVWLSTRTALYRYQLGQLTQVPFPKQQNRQPLRIRHMYAKDHHVIIETILGWVQVYDDRSQHALCRKGILRRIFRSQEAGYRIYTPDVVDYLDACEIGIAQPFASTPLSDDDGLKCLARPDADTTWWGGQAGLVQVVGDQIRYLQEADGLPSRRVNDLRWQADTLWIGTDMGLAYWHRDSLARWDLHSSLGRTPVRQVLSDPWQRLWLATPSGLFCRQGKRWLVFSLGDGLPSRDITRLMVDRDSVLWVTTSLGGSRLDLRRPLPLKAAPQVFFQRIETDGQPLSLSQTPRLSYRQNLLVSLGSITPRQQRPLLWQYRLRSDAPWQSTDARELALSNLRDGRYQLAVRARLYTSDWTSPLTWTFEVSRPWYRRTGVLALLLSLTVGLITGTYLVVQRQRTQKMEIQRRLAGLELQALQAQMNPHFIFNALNAIQHFVLTHEVKAANDYLSRFAQLVRRFLEGSRQRFHSLEDELALLDSYLEMEHLCYGEWFSYRLCQPEARLLDWDLPVMLLQPLVENAIRHGVLPRATPGWVEVRFEQQGMALRCVVEDNGVGRQVAQRRHAHPSRGLQLLRDRIDTLNRAGLGPITLTVEDLYAPDGSSRGTRVVVVVSEESHPDPT